MARMHSFADRLSAARRHGLRTAGRIAAGRVEDRARHLLFLDEEHLWYAMDLPAPAAAPFAGGDGMRLVSPATPAELAAFDRLPTLPADAAAGRRGDGGEPWVVLDGDTPLFACWIFAGRAPVLAAPGGWLDIPEGCVCLEDSVAAPAARGRGIGPRTWRALAHRYAGLGTRAVLTKVASDNTASRRAVAKAGFREIALQRYRRRGPRTHVEVDVLAPGVADELRARLAR